MDTFYFNLLKHKKVNISLDELAECYEGVVSYEVFYREVMALIDSGIIEAVASSGTNGFSKPLANRYRINKGTLEESKRSRINEKVFKSHRLLSLEAYFPLPLEVFEQDEPYIDMISTYLEYHDLPKGKLAPEVSFLFTGNEKWIEKGLGKKVLERLRLWDMLAIDRNPDPIAFSINRNQIGEVRQRHLIIENKTPYIHLMDVIEKSKYSTLIYGQGWKITSGLEMFYRQYPFGQSHEFLYFGDVDKEGIAIFCSLKERFGKAIIPAKEFYSQLNRHKQSSGKTNQTCSKTRIRSFIEELEKTDNGFNLNNFDPNYIEVMLENGCYQPQEVLSQAELVEIMIGGRREKINGL